MKSFGIVVGYAVGLVLALWLLGRSEAPTPLSEEMQALRGGYEAIDPDGWSDFVETVGNRGEGPTAWDGAVVAAFFTTDEEYLAVMRIRAELFERVADDPVAAPICRGVTAVPAVDKTVLRRAMASSTLEMQGTLGRAYARRELGTPAWVAPVDLASAEADGTWQAFVTYMDKTGHEATIDVMIDFADGLQVGDADVCVAMAGVYRTASEQPTRTVGGVRLIDFVRSLDAVGLNEGYPAP